MFFPDFDESRMLVARRLTAERFAPFGRLVTPTSDAQPSAETTPTITELATTLSAPVLNTRNEQWKRAGRAYSAMWRRPSSETAYQNMGPSRALLVVAPSIERNGFPGDDHSRRAAFIVAPNQSFVINQGIWSSDPRPLDGLIVLRCQWYDQPGNRDEGFLRFDPPSFVKLRQGRTRHPHKELMKKLAKRGIEFTTTASD